MLSRKMLSFKTNAYPPAVGCCLRHLSVQLRPHQRRAIEMVNASFGGGYRTVLLAAPCSFGKTHTAAAILKLESEKGKRCVFFVDRIKLVSQTLEIFDEWGLDFGVIQANHPLSDPEKPVQIASIQTVARRKAANALPPYDFAIVDECHVSHKLLESEIAEKRDASFLGLSATP